MINGITDLIMTKVDILNSFNNIKICTEYEVKGKKTKKVPYDLSEAKPIYKNFKGWKSEISDKIPEELENYIKTIEGYLNTKISYISFNSNRKGIMKL
jgi:adenylosuccinate synthase